MYQLNLNINEAIRIENEICKNGTEPVFDYPSTHDEGGNIEIYGNRIWFEIYDGHCKRAYDLAVFTFPFKK